MTSNCGSSTAHLQMERKPCGGVARRRASKGEVRAGRGTTAPSGSGATAACKGRGSVPGNRSVDRFRRNAGLQEKGESAPGSRTAARIIRNAGRHRGGGEGPMVSSGAEETLPAAGGVAAHGETRARVQA